MVSSKSDEYREIAMDRRQRLSAVMILIGAAFGVALLTAGAVYAAISTFSPAAIADDTVRDKDEDYVPEAERVPAEERDWSTSKELEPKLLAAFNKVDQLLEFPDEDSRERARTIVATMGLDPTGAYENGIADQYVLDTWECEWVAYAMAAADAGDREGIIRAGENMIQRIEVPGQREMQPDWGLIAADIQPMIGGDFESVREGWEFQCFSDADGELTSVER